MQAAPLTITAEKLSLIIDVGPVPAAAKLWNGPHWGGHLVSVLFAGQVRGEFTGLRVIPVRGSTLGRRLPVSRSQHHGHPRRIRPYAGGPGRAPSGAAATSARRPGADVHFAGAGFPLAGFVPGPFLLAADPRVSPRPGPPAFALDSPAFAANLFTSSESMASVCHKQYKHNCLSFANFIFAKG